MLKDLNEVAVNARQRYRNEFMTNEFVLSDAFKEAYGASLRSNNQDIDFTAHTAIITTSGSLKMYIPNQWFCAAAYMVPFVQAFLEYKKLTDSFFALVFMNNNDEKKRAVRDLKESNNPDVKERFKDQIRNYLETRIQENELDETVEFLTRFVSDYEWWFGSKTIDRSDSYVSPILSLLDVVNSSQSYIADICYKFATESKLAEVANQMIDQGTDGVHEDAPITVPEIEPTRVLYGKNEIVYGAPGTGKSQYVNDTYINKSVSTRVVFHPEYTFFDFVGVYKPVSVYKNSGEEFRTLGGDLVAGEPYIDYRFVPGPFISCLVSAWLNPTQMHSLVIEEINRANAAAVFGDIFQLLDRDGNGMSEYGITPSYDLEQYLLSIDGFEHYLKDGLRIPSNMNIIATMNSADQGVMPMDSAFKRRWSFRYMKIEFKDVIVEKTALRYSDREVYWGNLVRAINYKLVTLGFEEDRLIGPYFIKPNEICKSEAIDKLLLYLWDDVLRHNHDSFFNNNVKTFVYLSEKFSSSDVFDLLARDETKDILFPPEPAVNDIEDDATEVEDEIV